MRLPGWTARAPRMRAGLRSGWRPRLRGSRAGAAPQAAAVLPRRARPKPTQGKEGHRGPAARVRARPRRGVDDRATPIAPEPACALRPHGPGVPPLTKVNTGALLAANGPVPWERAFHRCTPWLP